MSAGDAEARIAELQRENRALSDQHKRLIKTESRLYRTQRQVDAQLKRIHALNAFALAAGRSSGPTQVLAQAADTVLAVFPFEQVVGLCCSAGALAAVATRAVAGREAIAAEWSAPMQPALEQGELRHPILFAQRPGLQPSAALAPFVDCCQALFGPAPAGELPYLLLPLWRRQRTPLGFVVARRTTSIVTFHEPLPGERDLAFLQLLTRHIESAIESATLMQDLADLAADLEVRVRSRTAELADANARLDANLRQLREAQDQLVLAGKMAALGTLAAGLSHELNNPIGVILGSAQVLLEQTREPSPALRPLQAIERQARRCANLVSALLDFARQRSAARERIPAGTLLDRVARLAASHERRHQVQLTVHAAAGPLPQVEVCATEIESALLNLITNAFDATPAGGKIDVHGASAPAGGQPGVRFSVRDTGHGIGPDVLPRIFDPFFTTKNVGKGTGLGLSLTRRIVDAHGGSIRVDSTVDGGTTFELWLPAVAGERP